MDSPLVLMTVALPALGGLSLLVRSKKNVNALYQSALLSALCTLALAVAVVWKFDPSLKTPQLTFRYAAAAQGAAPSPAHLLLGVEPRTVWMLPLTALLLLASIAASRPVEGEPRPSWGAQLALATSVMGVFTAYNSLLGWALLFLSTLVSGRLLDGPDDQERRRAARGLTIVLLLCDLILLLALISLLALARSESDQWIWTFRGLASAPHGPAARYSVLCIAAATALAIRGALFPFHGWLLSAVKQARTGAPLLVCLLPLASLGAIYRIVEAFTSRGWTVPLADWLAPVGAAGFLWLAVTALMATDLRTRLVCLMAGNLSLVGVAFLSTMAGHFLTRGVLVGLFHLQLTSLAIGGLLLAIRDNKLPRRGGWLLAASLIGLPPLGGFASRVSVFPAVTEAGVTALMLVLAATVVSGLAIAQLLVREDRNGDSPAELGRQPVPLTVRLLGLALLLAGLFPQRLLGLYLDL